MKRLRAATIDMLAERYQKLRAEAEEAEEKAAALRKNLIEEVLAQGSVPARATKTVALAGERFELRVTRSTEVTVDTKSALALREACRYAGKSRLFSQLLRKVVTFTLRNGIDDLAETVPLKRGRRRIMSLYSQAIRVRELAPQLEVRAIENEERKAG